MLPTWTAIFLPFVKLSSRPEILMFLITVKDDQLVETIFIACLLVSARLIENSAKSVFISRFNIYSNIIQYIRRQLGT